MHDTVLFTPAQGDEALGLQKAIEENATESDETRPMKSAFLVLRQYQSKAAPNLVAAQLLMALGPPYTRQLKIDAATSWEPVDVAACRDHLSQWLTEGLASEPPVYRGNESQAEAFLTTLFDWAGPQSACFENPRSLFRSGAQVDRGAIVVGPRRVGLLWFLGWS